ERQLIRWLPAFRPQASASPDVEAAAAHAAERATHTSHSSDTTNNKNNKNSNSNSNNSNNSNNNSNNNHASDSASPPGGAPPSDGPQQPLRLARMDAKTTAIGQFTSPCLEQTFDLNLRLSSDTTQGRRCLQLVFARQKKTVGYIPME
ncbi:unnamed protein product, partial [Polarella glacialis]